MNAKVCIITGANRGIGKAMAIEMASKNYLLIMVCRNEGQARTVKEEIVRKTGNNKISIVTADLGSLKEIIAAAQQISTICSKVDVLINNAGVFRSGYRASQDGIEEQYAVNYFSVFAFTHELLDLLHKSDDPRVINFGSNMHRLGTNPFLVRNKGWYYNGISAYANSKLAVMLFTFQFARKYGHIKCNAFHPGAVKTEIGNKYSKGIFRLGWKLASSFFSSPSASIKTGLSLACDESIPGSSGNYFYKNKIVTPSPRVRDGILAEKLWNETYHEYIKLKERQNAERPGV